MGIHLTFPEGVISGGASAFTTLLFDGVLTEDWAKASEVTSHPVETGADVTDNVRVGLSECTLVVFCTNEPYKANSFTTPTVTQTTVNIPGAPARTQVQQIITQQWDNALNFRAFLKGVGSFTGQAAGGQLGSVIGTAIGGIAGMLIDPAGPRPYVIDASQLGTDAPTPYSVAPSLQTQGSPGDYVTLMDQALEALQVAATLITVVGSKKTKKNMVITNVALHRDADTGTGGEFTITLQEIRFVSTQTVTAPAPSIPRATPAVAKGPQDPKPVTPAQRKSIARKFVLQAMGVGAGAPSTDQLSAMGLSQADLVP